jgi:MbtH protein
MTTDPIDRKSADGGEFLVVLNDEEQYSIWLADRDLPLGWKAEGTRGTRDSCLAHIDAIWTDIRPLSVRRRMTAEAAGEV